MTKRWTSTVSGVQPKRQASKRERVAERRLLHDLRAYIDDERHGVIDYACYGDVIERVEKTGEMPRPSEIDPSAEESGLRKLFRRQCRLIARIDEALK